MALTPEDVRNKAFSATRLREGYDMGEVDAFLDEVEEELARLLAENDELRARLGDAPERSEATAPAVAEEPEAVEVGPEPAEVAPEVSAVPVAPAPASAPAAPAAPERITVTTTAEVSAAAARLLEIAIRDAAELESSAAAEAERLVAEATSTAEQLNSKAAAQAEQVESEARARAQSLDTETEERRARLLGDIDKEREQVKAEVETLRAFEREYRSRLKSYFAQQLENLDAWNPSPDAASQGAPDGK